MDKITHFMRATKQTRPHEPHTPKKPVRAAVQSPHDAKPGARDGDTKQGNVPHFIYQTVKYTPRSQPRKVSREMQIVTAYIQTNYKVPRDFEQSHRFGPHSGLTYETRLARAYSLRQLSPKQAGNRHAQVAGPKPICLTCAAVGHSYKECPDGF